MKRLLLIPCIFMVISIPILGQTVPVKIGYADVDYIYSRLPVAKQIESELKSLQNQLENQLKGKYDEFKTKYDQHSKRESTMTHAELLNARKELQLLRENLQKFEQECQIKFQQKQKQLMEPVTQSIQKAIAAVATENGYQFILNAGAGKQDIILHADHDVDVSDIILQKLGVAPTVATQH